MAIRVVGVNSTFEQQRQVINAISTDVDSALNSSVAFAQTAGIATVAQRANVATVAEGITGAPDAVVGVLTATSFDGDGSTLSGVVTSIVGGQNVTVSNNSGVYTINSSGGGGGTGQDGVWETTSAGINTVSNVGIGNTMPDQKLVVSGNGRFTGVVTAFRLETSGGDVTSFIAGLRAAANLSNSAGNILVGDDAGSNLASNSDYNVAIGSSTLSSASASGLSGNVAIGKNAFKEGTTGYDNVAIGKDAFQLATDSFGSVAIGASASGGNQSGEFTVAIGYKAGYTQSGVQNVLIGDGAGEDSGFQNNGNLNVAVGSKAGAKLNTGGYNTLIGSLSGDTRPINGSYNTGLGAYTLRNLNSGSYNTAAGNSALAGGTIAGNYNTGFGNQALYNVSTGDGNVAMGHNALFNIGAGSNNVAIGNEAGYELNDAQQGNVLLGYRTGYDSDGGDYNTLIGYYAGSQYENDYNVAIGYFTGYQSGNSRGQVLLGSGAGYECKGDFNIGIGWNSLYDHDGNGGYNIAIGYESLYRDGAVSDFNIGIGYRAIYGTTNTSGNYNIALGREALFGVQEGEGNIVIGNYAAKEITSGTNNVVIIAGSTETTLGVSPTGTQQLVIGSGHTSWISGTSNYNVGIGSTLPASKLDVDGDVAVTGVVTATRFESSSAGTPTIDSPNNLNINAVTVAISTDLSVGRNVTAQQFVGDGSGLTGIVAQGTGIVIQDESSSVGVAGTINFVGTGVTATLSNGIASVEVNLGASTDTLDDVLARGATTTRDITTTGKVLFANHYATLGDLPSATTYHGMFAHVHAEGHGYFAHAGNWIQMLDTAAVLSDLTNVSSNAPQNNDVLTWNGSEWAPAAAQTGGGGSTQNLFGTIAIAGQNNVVADNASDTLTLVAGTNMTITTDPNTDTITFASSGGGGGAETDTLQSVTTRGNITTTEITAAGYRTNATQGDGSDIGFAIKYYITANGSSAYRFAGPGILNTVDDPTLYFHRGFTYILENSTGSTHPFALRATAGGAGYSPGGQFLSGSQTGTQILTVPFDAPSSIVYQCTAHSSMVGTINFVS